jgi:hypothetical protein
MAKALVSLGIAATAFYAPVVPLAMYLLYRNWRRLPKIAWYPFILLSLSKHGTHSLRICEYIRELIWLTNVPQCASLVVQFSSPWPTT